MQIDTSNRKLLDKKEVCNQTSWSNATLWRRIDKGLFPPSFTIGGTGVRWFDYEVEAVISGLSAGKSKEDIKQLVKDLIALRQPIALS